MPKSNDENCIINTIIQLRSRKSRPDLDKICHMVQRKHGLSSAETQAVLQRLIDEGKVVKVEYKGSISHRIPSQIKDTSMKGRMSVENSDRDSVLEAVRVLSVSIATPTSPTSLTSLTSTPKTSETETKAVLLTQDVVEQWLAKKKRTIDNVQEFLQDLVKTGIVNMHPDGRYSIVEQTDKKVSDNSKGGTGSSAKVKEEERECAATSKSIAATSPDQAMEASSGMPMPGTSGSSLSLATVASKHSPSKRGRPYGATSKRKTKVSRSRGHPSDEFDPSPEGGSSKQAKREKFDPPLEGGSIVEEAETKPSDLVPPAVPMEEDEPRCDFCLQTAAANKRRQPEELLACVDCKAKAHPSCMDYSDDLARRAKKSPWQCIDCKTCNCCNDSGDADEMLFCDACDKGYHMNCHKPPVTKKPTGNWMCHECEQEGSMVVDDISQPAPTQQNSDVCNSDGGGPSCLPTPNASPTPSHEDDGSKLTAPCKGAHTAPSPQPFERVSFGSSWPPLPKLSLTIPRNVPNASNWTIDDVAGFFCKVGFPEQAETFREQEIDGKSLLLLKRNDVLTGLSMRLGPALKIFAHVQRLQTAGDPLH